LTRLALNILNFAANNTVSRDMNDQCDKRGRVPLVAPFRYYASNRISVQAAQDLASFPRSSVAATRAENFRLVELYSANENTPTAPGPHGSPPVNDRSREHQKVIAKLTRRLYLGRCTCVCNKSRLPSARSEHTKPFRVIRGRLDAAELL